MKKRNSRMNVFGAVGAMVLVGILWTSASWGATTQARNEGPKFSSQIYDISGDVDQNTVLSPSPAKTRAPEPSTLALFGSGLLGMIMSFIRKTYAVIKRLFDICIALAALVLLAPLYLATALAVKLTSKGPVLFSQIRVGKGGKLFNMYKFRSMRTDAEKDTGPVWASKNDPRITPIGKFLRKTRIDEIPQFINVLKGDMSFIGPRPERPMFVEKFKTQISDYEKRLLVKPGITGMAQVRHKYDETIDDVRKKIKYDLFYIKNLHIRTDLDIFMRTFQVVLTGQGAK